MKVQAVLMTVAFASAVPAVVAAQHSHGGPGGRDDLRIPQREKETPPKLPAGMLPLGSPRPIEVLVVYYGFSPKEIRADVGETVILQVRRSAPLCVNGLSIPNRDVNIELPLGETVPVTLELKRVERIELRCEDEDTSAVIVVGSP